MSNKVLLIGYPLILKKMCKCLYVLGNQFDFLIESKHKQKFDESFPDYTGNVFFITSFDDTSYTDYFYEKSYDYIFSYIFSLLIPSSLISKALKGAYNIHPSYLPYFAGPNPYFWTIRSNVPYGGLTIHHLTDKFDAGDIVVQIKIPLNSLETSSSYKIKCDNVLPDLFKLFFGAIKNSNHKNIIQKDRFYFNKPSFVDYLIDWNYSANEVNAIVRACNTELTCRITLSNISIELLEVEITDKVATVPGTVLIENNELFISCDDFFIRISVVFIPKVGFFSGKNFVAYYNLV